ncbi:choice-of-anchor A family protein [Hyalangium minutum]|uniref:choice-of-anchor A family protein n=1 Tax=Hyalangium minutum TaxID=394096 RepID=UPI000693416C|nr:choice-of-anchor A family protein [Hyalangium minutum]
MGDYNLFLIEGATTVESTVEGKVAAGGNIALTRSEAGSVLPNNAPSALMAGGDLTVSGGTLHGDVRYGGSYTDRGTGCASGCTMTPGIPSDFNFADRRDKMLGLSSRLADQQGLDATLEYGNVKMNGADPCLNIFNVTNTHLTGAWAWSINAPASSFVVINVRSTHPASDNPFSFNGFSTLFSGGITPQRVLYHFVDATRIDIGSTEFKGTVLAPHARVTFSRGHLFGGMYALSLNLSGAIAHVNALDELGGECEEGTNANCATSCGSTGTRVCGATCSWGACTPPAAEACNGVDDTCDGQVDEGFECTGSSSRSCTAWCGAAGMQTCNPATCGYGECASSSCCRADTDCASGSYCEGNTCEAHRGNGAACTAANQCSSSQCVDGVCCDSTCGGACDACNILGNLGTCSFLPSTTVCRAANGSCDAAEMCIGTSSSCPADAKKPATTVCRASNGACDAAESCTGTSDSCPGDGFLPSGTACTNDSNACTLDICDASGNCSHPSALPGTSCGSGLICTSAGQCTAGCWIGGTYYASGATNPAASCQTCNPSVSTTSWSNKPVNTPCGTPSAGAWGACGGFNDVCDPIGSQSRSITTYTCSEGNCAGFTSSESQSCSRTTTGTPCNDSNSCTTGDVCNSSGTCGGTHICGTLNQIRVFGTTTGEGAGGNLVWARSNGGAAPGGGISNQLPQALYQPIDWSTAITPPLQPNQYFMLFGNEGSEPVTRTFEFYDARGILMETITFGPIETQKITRSIHWNASDEFTLFFWNGQSVTSTQVITLPE